MSISAKRLIGLQQANQPPNRPSRIFLPRAVGELRSNTMTRMLAQAEFHEALKDGTAAGAIVTRQAMVLRARDDGSRIVRFVFSDGSIDRMGDTIIRMVGI